jgi:hypothetical protein
MTKARLSFLVLCLFVSTVVPGQASRPATGAANKSWQSFWTQFSRAMNKKDLVALRSMMSDNFTDNGGGATASDWVKGLNDAAIWRDHKASVASGTRPFKYEGRPTRITKDEDYHQLIFVFGKDGHWRWAAMMGD